MSHPVVAIAIRQLGTHEATHHNDGVPLERYGLDGEQALPWCARFVRWCWEQAGRPLPGNKWELGSVSHMERVCREHDWLLRPGVRPEPGDIIFFVTRGQSDPGKGRHVGIVEKATDLEVFTVEGNTSDAVARRSYLLSNQRISGYGRVPMETA